MVASTLPPSRLYLMALESRLLKHAFRFRGRRPAWQRARRRECGRRSFAGSASACTVSRAARATAATSTSASRRFFSAGLDLREVQQVGDQFVHAVDAVEAAVDHFAVGRPDWSPNWWFLQHFEVAGHGVQGGLELVAQHANELEADLALLLGQLAGPAWPGSAGRPPCGSCSSVRRA